MNSHQYCQDKIATPGSSIYYSLLAISESQRNAILGLRTWYQEITGVVFECHDPQLAQTKLSWWRTEIEALQQQSPTHPVTQLLLPIYNKLDFTALQEIITTISRDLHSPVYDKQLQLLTYYQESAGAFEKLLLPIYQPSSDTCATALEYFGIFIQMVVHLRDIRLALQHGRTYISGESLMQHQVTLKQLVEFKATSGIKEMFKEQALTAKSYYQKALASVDKTQHKNILPTIKLAKLHFALLEEIIRSDFPILEHRISLTPIRKWWISWRSV